MIQGIDQAFSKWLPEPHKEEAKPISSSPQKITARVDIHIPDQCPVCKTTMSKADAHGLAVYVCHKDRVVLPQPD